MHRTSYTVFATFCESNYFAMKSLREFPGGPGNGPAWLGCHASTAGGTDSIPSWGTMIPQNKIPQAVWYGQKKKVKINR